MGYFPVCVDLTGKTVVLVGSGEQIRDKVEKLRPFGPRMVFRDDLTAEDLAGKIALVVVGDKSEGEAERIAALCELQQIPVNVVDQPRLCTFFFPSLIAMGDLTVSVSTGGKSPAAAVCLRQRMEAVLPDRSDEIIQWLHENRAALREKGVLKAAAKRAFALNRPLTREEWEV